MSKFLLTDWEINGYDDSDFMASFYDDVKNTIGFVCYGSTRYPSATIIGHNADGSTSVEAGGENLRMPNAEVVEKARLVLEDAIFQRLQDADKRLVDTPDVEDLAIGLSVRLKATARMQVRESSPCQKCGGTGKWINPRNNQDQRNCFTCNGSGNVVGSKVKAEGKQVWRTLVIGTTGEVLDWTSFGQFYANGYNKPNRDNTTVQFRNADGELLRASLNKLKLNRDYKPEAELREKAKSLSFHYGFSSLYPRFAWDTCNYAAQVAAPIHR